MHSIPTRTLLAIILAWLCAGRADATSEKPILLDQATVALLAADLKAADTKCPAKAVPGAMVQVATCILREERFVWTRYSPRTLDLFDVFATQQLAIAQKYDDKVYTAADFHVATGNARAQFRTSLRQRLNEEFRSNLKSALAACPSRGTPGQMVQIVTCSLVDHQRIVWARYQPQTLDLFDSFSAQHIRLAQKLDSGEYSPAEYEAAWKALWSNFPVAIKERFAAIQAQPPNPTGAPQVSPASPGPAASSEANAPLSIAPPPSVPAASLSSAAIAPSDACLLVSSLVGVIAGAASRRADTALNSANAYLKGCMQGVGQ